MYLEDDLLQLSGLQHLLYCSRQCALAYMELQWADNFFTAKGILMHDKAHSDKREVKNGVVIERDIYIKSYALGLVGKSDIVEFHKSGAQLIPFPVEYKSGKAKNDNTDKVQLCAQALCLEEMLKIEIPSGAIFYGKTKNRLNVEFDNALREETINLAKDFHNLIESGITPKAQASTKCNNCSFKELCLPELTSGKKSAKKYLQSIVTENNTEN
ncbi:CRISPR-associated protein Cas4 [Endomicrobium proavitum]|uniref:CRISPR-associated exonuclease Cas4 n=1 Tax=Endomicrobium proavitum TaxID=1408281 RepID=A0A0G3WKU1_9BACT|nr:CRISPR-associated protein Cas4 [Endomicrobium proavitum]AKL98462.1 CRISPR-associated protein Cas4 [Endomicrobium proavitum]